MKYVSINRNPFSRTETIRQKASGKCAFCSGQAKFRYGTESDGGRKGFDKNVFCGKACREAYNG